VRASTVDARTKPMRWHRSWRRRRCRQLQYHRFITHRAWCASLPSGSWRNCRHRL